MKEINSSILLNMLESGCNEVSKNYEYINELNVFPVPDGDTGTNMKITLNSALNATKEKINNNSSLHEIGTIFCRQLLMNARGNSGVIFSQIFRGFFIPIIPETKSIDCDLLIECLKNAKEKSYKSISNPVEGTILTIIRIIVEKLENKKFDDIINLFKNILEIGLDALKLTPDLLPSLKEAKVVDSGGYGLCKFFEGMYISLNLINQMDEDINNHDFDIKVQKKINEIVNYSISSKNTFIKNETRFEISEEGFGYCCEFIIQKNFITHEKQETKFKFDFEKFENELLQVGDSLVCVVDFEIIKVHIHSLTPYKVLKLGQKYGEFLKVKIDNMTQQYLENHPHTNPQELFTKFSLTNDIKIVATCQSQKIADYLQKEFLVDQVIILEDNCAPSTSDFANKIIATKSKNVIVLLDDSNHYLSAINASEIIDKKINIEIIKSKNISELIAACLAFDSSKDLNENIKKINRVVKKHSSGMISISAKTCKLNNVHIEKNDYIAVNNKKIILAEKKSEYAVNGLIDSLMKHKTKKTNIVYIVYGKNVTNTELRSIEKFVNEKYGMKVKFIEGRQKVYQYCIGFN